MPVTASALRWLEENERLADGYYQALYQKVTLYWGVKGSGKTGSMVGTAKNLTQRYGAPVLIIGTSINPTEAFGPCKTISLERFVVGMQALARLGHMEQEREAKENADRELAASSGIDRTIAAFTGGRFDAPPEVDKKTGEIKDPWSIRGAPELDAFTEDELRAFLTVMGFIGGIWILDEAQNYFNAVRRDRLARTFIDFLNIVRHHGNTVLMSAPKPTEIDNQIRHQVDFRAAPEADCDTKQIKDPETGAERKICVRLGCQHMLRVRFRSDSMRFTINFRGRVYFPMYNSYSTATSRMSPLIGVKV